MHLHYFHGYLEKERRNRRLLKNLGYYHKLTSVLRDVDATEYLREFRNLEEAYERCDGESLLLIKYLKRANRDLGRSLHWLRNIIMKSEIQSRN